MPSDVSSKARGARRGRRKGVFNIGTFLFLAVFVYLLIALIMYLARGHVTPYEVTEGVIVDDSIFTGVIIRSETVVTSPRDGYLNYYLDDKSKSGQDQHVCAISGTKPDDSGEQKAKSTKGLSSAQESALLASIQEYVSTYSPDEYSNIYTLHDEIDAAYGFTSADYLTSQLDQLAKDGNDIEFVDAPDDGLIVYSSDNLDELTIGGLDDDVFEQNSYKERVISQGMKVKKDDSIFKLITDENWSVVFQLNRKTAEKLKETDTIETRLGNMKSSLWADFEIIESGGKNYGKLSYSTDMFRFASSRFVNVELILQNDSGLKIPSSAVAEKKICEIPGEFVITDPDTAKTGVQVIGDDGGRKFTALNVFFCQEDGKTGEKTYYIKTGQFEDGTKIGKDNSSKTYTLGKKKTFKGVYNINKGYAVFQYIDIIASNDDYYIVKDNSTYGPMTYDRIALNAAKIKENQIVH